MRIWYVLAVLSLLGLLLPFGTSACGSSSSSSGNCNCVTVYVFAVRETASNCNAVGGGSVLQCFVGDTANDDELRGIVEFSLASLPPGTRLASAYVTVFETMQTGDPNPLGDMLLDHVDGTQLIGDPTDCVSGTLEADFTALFEDNAWTGGAPAWSGNIVSQLQDDIDLARSMFTLRIRTAGGTNGNRTADFREFGGVWADGSTYRSRLTVKYYLP